MHLSLYPGDFLMLRWILKNSMRGRRSNGRAARRERSRKLLLEILEDRTVPSPLTAGTTGFHATEGLLYNGAVANFTDGNTQDTAANFTATISWGDNTSSAGMVTGSNGSFTVSGQHAYVEQGHFPGSGVV